MYPPLNQYGISSPYGPRAGSFHRGVDIPCPTGTDIPSPIDGHIAFEGAIRAAAPGYPDEIICIIQGKGQFVVMGHLSATLVNNGQSVKKGHVVARSGNTGYSTGPHLHIELCEGTKSPSRGLLAYPSIDITPLLQNYSEGGSMTEEQVFGACFITQATRWPTKNETDAWKKSVLPAWEWVQEYAPDPTRDQERINAFAACFITLATRWPTKAETKTWQKSGISAYSWCQKNAPNVIANEKSKVIQKQEEQIQDLHIKLEEYEKTEGADAQVGRKFRELIKEVI